MISQNIPFIKMRMSSHDVHTLTFPISFYVDCINEHGNVSDRDVINNFIENVKDVNFIQVEDDIFVNMKNVECFWVERSETYIVDFSNDNVFTKESMISHMNPENIDEELA